MRIKPFYIASFLIVILFSNCKKDLQQNTSISSGNVSDYSTDGLLSVQVSISGNSTQSTFLANTPSGAVSYTSYDLVAGTKKIYTDYFHVAAPYPTVFAMLQHPNGDNQPYPYQVLSQIFPGKSINIATSILYNNVDSSTSPTEVTCVLKDIVYHTEDYTSHTLNVDDVTGSSPSMCLVNNIPHMSFLSPASYVVQSNGNVEMADIKLTGDTSYTLKSIPVNFYFPEGVSSGTFPKKLIVKYQKNNIASAVVSSNHSAVITFPNGFKHVAGKTEVLKVFGKNLVLNLPSFFITEMGDLQGLSWHDGLGGFIPGSLNSKYFKEDTGGATLYNH